VSFLALRYLGFGDPSSISPTVVDFAESMIRSTPTDVIADFYPALMSHDKLAALDVLDKVPTEIIVGDKDWLTPPDHSKSINAGLPSARLTEVPGASHLVLLEKPAIVNEALAELLKRVERDERFGGPAEDLGDAAAAGEA
jgi:pimeloyl-ACP methyl ester carboxylesterase